MECRSILVVDHADVIDSDSFQPLRAAGCQLEGAASPEQALSKLHQKSYDLVLVDAGLPPAGGLSFLREARFQGGTPRLALMDDQPSLDRAQAALRLGVHDYLAKPLSPRHLLEMVHRDPLPPVGEPPALFAILDNLGQGVVSVDRDLHIRFANTTAQRLLGYGRETPFHPGHFQFTCCTRGCRQLLEETLRTGRPMPVRTVLCQNPERRHPVPLKMESRPLLDGDGGCQGALLVLHDPPEIPMTMEQQGEQSFRHGLIVNSPSMRKVAEHVEALASVETTVLITGESGTGKEMVARALHTAGRRRENPLVCVNCSALPDNLLESELFGHVKGAFTNAIRDKAGRFEVADGGTLFLDEIGDISPAMQLRLLRVLQEKSFERVGDNRPIRVNVRIVAATNQDLEESVRAGRFREDLFYRLRVFTLHLPPLRERKAEIPPLVQHFIHQFNQQFQKSVTHLAAPALERLLRYAWPGNVRELRHALEHAFVLCRGNTIEPEHLPEALQDQAPYRPPGFPPMVLDEREGIIQALQQTRGNRGQAAALLGISRSTLYRKMRDHRLLEGF